MPNESTQTKASPVCKKRNFKASLQTASHVKPKEMELKTWVQMSVCVCERERDLGTIYNEKTNLE